MDPHSANPHPDQLPPLTWSYAMRQRAQEVIPGVFVGPYTMARNIPTLIALGISHCVLVQSTFEARLRTPQLAQHGIQVLHMTVEESQTQNVISLFPQFSQFVNQALAIRQAALDDQGPIDDPEVLAMAQGWNVHAPLARQGNVLVMCLDGMSRGPTFVIAYIMAKYALNLSTTMQYVQTRRYCVFPSDGFRYQLMEYEPILMAQQASIQGSTAPEKKRVVDSVADSGNASTGFSDRPTRRRREDSDDES
ncbi:protein-tyrosine phosphatase-like protein [Catenaria anguillulae PL171]|uniref:Protein-tyrosine phosphatase-like protein n=1 Tax=Catenaria anguillulae PL171 TaxID=765915 RepID=A0A1Y2HY37_9FUNG|nr:protein-tyrosine phosphatase-like protein [Catenaria anguillulae PL171]